MSPELNRPLRSLDQYLAELSDQLKLLPLQSKLRPRLITAIREVEAEIAARKSP